MSMGSLFAGWMIHYTGEYKILNLIFGTFPFIGTTLITQISESSGPIQSWLSIVRCLGLPSRENRELIDVDSSRYWKRYRNANDAKYGVPSNHAINLLNKYVVALLAHLPGAIQV
jgi:hypothetical protein